MKVSINAMNLELAKEQLRDDFRNHQTVGYSAITARKRMGQQLGMRGKFKTEKIETLSDVQLCKSILLAGRKKFDASKVKL